jgi:hypothetical protein
MTTTNPTEKKTSRLNVGVGSEAHQALRVTAALDGHTMAETTRTAILLFANLPEEERSQAYNTHLGTHEE